MRLAALVFSFALGAAPGVFAQAEGRPGSACPEAAAPTPADLGRLIDERLSLMPDVARLKWNSGAPVEDSERERRVIEGIRAQAPAYGLAPEFAVRFFTAQIEAAKLLQVEHIAAWRRAGVGKFESVPDLAAEIRPRLDALTPRLLCALAAQRQLPGAPLSRQDFRPLAAEKLSPAAVARALAPLVEGGTP